MRPIQIEGCNHYSIAGDGVVVNTETGRVLKTDLNSCGYKRVTLWSKAQKRVRITVHRLVALHYVDNSEGKPYVNHIDGNKINNFYSNLEWVTCKENTRHAFDKGLRTGPNRLPDEVVRAVRYDKAKQTMTRSQVCEKHGISIHQYFDIGRYYNDVK